MPAPVLPAAEPQKLSAINMATDKELFESWSDHVPSGKLALVREVMHATASSLGSTSNISKKKRALRECVEKLNRLDEGQHFIMTIEREDLVELLLSMGEESGVVDTAEIIDELREW